MPEEPVTFESRDGIAISGIYRKPLGKPRAGVVLAHGIMTHKEYGSFHPGLAAELERQGFESIRFDFRGHGESGGKPEEVTIAGEVDDLAAAVRFLSDRHRSPVGIVGTSLGAAIAVLYAARAPQPPFALVLLSAVLDLRRTFLEPETPWGKKWFTPAGLATAHATGALTVGGFTIGVNLVREFGTVEPAQVLRRLTVPVLMIHGGEDPVAPFGAASDASRSAPGVRFVRIDVQGHYFEGFQDRVFREVSTWLETQVPSSPAS